jgi:hypothetical protein
MASSEGRIAAIEERVAAIEERNRRVEADKAWETSLSRRGAIVLITYVIATLTFAVIGTETPYVMAVIPTLGYLLSTLALLPLRKRWRRAHQVHLSTSASLSKVHALMSRDAPGHFDTEADLAEQNSLRRSLRG